MAGVLESLARGLRQAGGILSPDVQKQLAGEDAQDNAERRQVEMLRLQQRLQQETPEYQARMEALKNEKLFREAVAGASGDMTKIAGAAVQYGKPELALNLYKQQEDRAARLQQSAEALDLKRTQLEQTHSLNLQRITDANERRAETARHNQALEALTARSNEFKRENAGLANQLKLLDLELKGNKIDAEKLRTLNTNTTKLGAALEKANLPEADAVLGSVEKALEDAPKIAEYISGPKSLLPDLAVPDEVKFGRQAFQKLFNITLKNRSGAAVTIPELERLKQEFATGALKTPQQLKAAVDQARTIINKHYASVASGFGPDVLEAYNENVRQFGGRVVLGGAKSSGGGGDANDPLGIR
jgi:hypothetical protein